MRLVDIAPKTYLPIPHDQLAALAYAGPGVLPRSGRDPGWGTEWETLPWSASQTMEFCYLNPGMDPARYQLLARLAGRQLPWPVSRRPG